jgi:hypothetical protein
MEHDGRCDPCRRSWKSGQVSRPASLAIGLSGEPVLEDEGVEAGLFPGLDSDGEGWWRRVMVSRDGGEQSKARAETWGNMGAEEVKRKSSSQPRAGFIGA